MKASPRAIVAGLTVAVVLAVSSAAVVTASSPNPVAGGPAGNTVCSSQRDALKANRTIDTLRAFGLCEIDRRLGTLDTLTSKINSSKVMTSQHVAALKGEIGSTQGGLKALRAKIQAEKDLKAMAAEVRQIATEFRVYALVVPQVSLVNGADGVAAAQVKFADVNTRLSQAIARAKAAGKDVTDAQKHLDAMNAAVSKASSLASGIPAAVLPLTPAQFNAGTAGPILTTARSNLVQARGQIRTAATEAKACRDALKALLPPKASPSAAA